MPLPHIESASMSIFFSLRMSWSCKCRWSYPVHCRISLYSESVGCLTLTISCECRLSYLVHWECHSPEKCRLSYIEHFVLPWMPFVLPGLVLLSIKLPMYLLFIWGWAWTYGFGWGKSISRGVWRGGPEISTFLGPNGTRYACCHFRAQKSLDFRPNPFKRPLLWITPPSKSIRPAPYKQQVH